MSCTLSPQSRAFSAVLTAFVGSIVNGLSSGYMVAFMTGWISWFATLRVLLGALYEFYLVFAPQHAYTTIAVHQPDPSLLLLPTTTTSTNNAPPEAHQDQQHAPYENIGLTHLRAGAFGTPAPTPASARLAARPKTDVSFLGWFGWIYTAVYTPVSQALWLAANAGPASGALKLARVVGISVSAFSLTVDTKARYGAALARRWGPWAGVAFDAWNAGVALGLGALCVVLLVEAVLDLGLPWFVPVIYVVFSAIWSYASFKILPVRDGGVMGGGIVLDVFVGAFAGVVLAAPAFVIWRSAKFAADTATLTGDDGGDMGVGLKEYLSCSSVVWWHKFVAIFP